LQTACQTLSSVF